jgi:hypothetical protein
MVAKKQIKKSREVTESLVHKSTDNDVTEDVQKTALPASEGKAKVVFSLSVTKNLGNYESLKIMVSAEDYCDSDNKDVAWDRLAIECQSRIEKHIEKLTDLKISLDEEEALSLDVDSKVGLAPACARTKAILVREIRKSPLEYDVAVEKLKLANLCEKEMRQVVHAIRRKDLSWFMDEEPASMDEFIYHEGNVNLES